MAFLNWPGEYADVPRAGTAAFMQPASNICLDLHGDPQRARLQVFSDGNHHMALEQALREFLAAHPRAADVFYVTTPPRVVVEALQAGLIRIGNLTLTVSPHVFISPPEVLEKLAAEGRVRAHRAYARNLGSALLVTKANPKRIAGIADLARADVRVFLSNPVTEAVSYQAYARTLRAVASREGVELDFLDAAGAHPRVVHGEAIHHREAPQCVADGRADVAVVYHHLALRYTRIFPDIFAMLPLGRGAGSDSAHVVNDLHIGLVGDGGAWGARLVEFMTGARVAAIYAGHGFTAA